MAVNVSEDRCLLAIVWHVGIREGIAQSECCSDQCIVCKLIDVALSIERFVDKNTESIADMTRIIMVNNPYISNAAVLVFSFTLQLLIEGLNGVYLFGFAHFIG